MAETFTIDGEIGGRNIGIIVTAIDNDNRQFKLEMITDAPHPATITLQDNGSWIINNPGRWQVSEKEFRALGDKIITLVNK